eukprot:4559477-Amphidinium_carterae.1
MPTCANVFINFRKISMRKTSCRDSNHMQDPNVGHRVLETFEGGHVLKVPISLDPWPEFVISPANQGRWALCTSSPKSSRMRCSPPSP